MYGVKMILKQCVQESLCISSILFSTSLKFMSRLIVSRTGSLCNVTTGLNDFPGDVFEVMPGVWTDGEEWGCGPISDSGVGVGCRSGSTMMAGDEPSDEVHHVSVCWMMVEDCGADSCAWKDVDVKVWCSPTPAGVWGGEWGRTSADWVEDWRSTSGVGTLSLDGSTVSIVSISGSAGAGGDLAWSRVAIGV